MSRKHCVCQQRATRAAALQDGVVIATVVACKEQARGCMKALIRPCRRRFDASYETLRRCQRLAEPQRAGRRRTPRRRKRATDVGGRRDGGLTQRGIQRVELLSINESFRGAARAASRNP